jgi:hypothetical protein
VLEILPPSEVKIAKGDLLSFTETKSPHQDYRLWRLPGSQELPDTVASALRTIHITDFALRALMPDIAQKFSTLERAKSFTNDPSHDRFAYLLTEKKTNEPAALGWFRQIIIPSGDPDSATYDDYDLIIALNESERDAESFATAAIEIFGQHRARLRATDVINAGFDDFINHHAGNFDGVCVRVGTHRAISMMESERSGFERISSEPSGSQGGVFVRDF